MCDYGAERNGVGKLNRAITVRNGKGEVRAITVQNGKGGGACDYGAEQNGVVVGLYVAPDNSHNSR